MPTTHRRHGPRQRAQHPVPDRRDPAATAVYRSRRWRDLRATALAHQPLCVECLNAGRTEPATEVHHIEAITANPARAYDLTNLMPLCSLCHARIDAERRRNGTRQNALGAAYSDPTANPIATTADEANGQPRPQGGYFL